MKKCGPATLYGSCKLLLAKSLYPWRRGPWLFLGLAKEDPIIQNLCTKWMREDAIPKDGRSLCWKAQMRGKPRAHACITSARERGRYTCARGGCRVTSWKSRNFPCLCLKARAERGTQQMGAAPFCLSPAPQWMRCSRGKGRTRRGSVQCIPSRTVNHAE